MSNRLAGETSPYLLQHQHNPVDWYPWGPEAFEAARKLDRPIFLSVGYSTCYWCHVMERQSFENPAIAARMNDRFICIKVDREERPDVDQLYMTAVQLLTRQGGWPMSVFLLPDLRPFYGGTYFPPTDAHGRPGFPNLLNAIDDAFKNRRAEVEASAGQITGYLRQLAEPASDEKLPPAVDGRWIGDLISRSISDVDSRNGGFGGAPKFPRETLLELLLVYLASDELPGEKNGHSRRRQVREALELTLDALFRGGIRDQLGGGFHRYSTDSRWLVPHFEIMLYDNAMLAWCYAEAFRQWRDPRWAEAARGIVDFVLLKMTADSGAFFTAFDAEVDALEGASYLWTPEQIALVLGPDDAAIFKRVYGVDRGFNFADPHHGSGVPESNILYLPVSVAEAAGAIGLDESSLRTRLADMRRKLLAARDLRKQPLLDTKILTSWNALMIRGMAYAGQVLEEPAYVAAAVRAANYLLRAHRSSDGGLLRASGGFNTETARQRQIPGSLDDYSFLAQALLALKDSTGDASWEDQAKRLVEQMPARFGNGRADRGLFFTDQDAKDLIVRQKVSTDSPLPSGNAVAALVQLRLGMNDAARGIINTFAGQLQSQAEGMSAMLQAALRLNWQQAGHGLSIASSPPAPAPVSVAQTSRQVVDAAVSRVSSKELQVRITIAPGFHLNAHEPSAEIPLTPTTLSVPPGATVEYPPGDIATFDFAQSPLRIYSGEVVLRVVFADGIPENVPPLSLSFQPCSETACLMPVGLTLWVA